jgi:hypothetical protein
MRVDGVEAAKIAAKGNYPVTVELKTGNGASDVVFSDYSLEKFLTGHGFRNSLDQAEISPHSG